MALSVGVCSAKTAKIYREVEISHIRTALFPQPSEVLQETSSYSTPVGMCIADEEPRGGGKCTRTHFVNMR